VAIDVDVILRLPIQKKILLLAGTITVVIGLFLYLLYFPQYSRFSGLNTELEKLRSELEMQEKVADTLPKFKKEAKDLEDKFTTALKELPDKKEIPSLLTNISQLAQGSGLQITLFQPQKEVAMDFYEEIPVKLKLSGGYHELATFFDKVANLSRIVNIKDLSIGEATLEGDKVNLHSACTAITFRFIEKTPESAKGKKGKKAKKTPQKEEMGI
jgi:type IV pilus assembly protein PilO